MNNNASKLQTETIFFWWTQTEIVLLAYNQNQVAGSTVRETLHHYRQIYKLLTSHEQNEHDHFSHLGHVSCTCERVSNK